MDEYTGNKYTILHALSVLQDRLQVGTNLNFLVVVGDGNHLYTLKIEYSSAGSSHCQAIGVSLKIIRQSP